jgi:hypothetical protein
MTNDLWIRCVKLGSPVLSHSHDFRNPMVKKLWFPVKDSTEKPIHGSMSLHGWKFNEPENHATLW